MKVNAVQMHQPQVAPKQKPKEVSASEEANESQTQKTSELQKSNQPKPGPAAKDTVKISSAGQKALQEATETTVQTAQEARNGDQQAKRLLAREAAAKSAEQPSANAPLKGAISKLQG